MNAQVEMLSGKRSLVQITKDVAAERVRFFEEIAQYERGCYFNINWNHIWKEMSNEEWDTYKDTTYTLELATAFAESSIRMNKNLQIIDKVVMYKNIAVEVENKVWQIANMEIKTETKSFLEAAQKAFTEVVGSLCDKHLKDLVNFWEEEIGPLDMDADENPFLNKPNKIDVNYCLSIFPFIFIKQLKERGISTDETSIDSITNDSDLHCTSN